jgi:hypothetical protein
MANNVFANGREIACKAGAGKTIAAFPDVCFTPPENPATPPGVPIPYPNTGFASDTAKGSKKVIISNKEIMLKNKSYFKKSTGDEAGCAAKKGVITSKNTGKVYFNAWSMDVKIEGENVDRHLDLTTNNHASMPGDTPPWPFTDGMVLPSDSPLCDESNDALVEEADTLPDNMSRIHEDSVTRRENRTIADAYGGRSPPATTLAVGVVLGGSSEVITAHSRKTVGEASRRQHFAKGIDSPDASKAKGCADGKPFQYREGELDHRHAEAKIIEDWFKKGGQGQLVLNVSRPVCPNCAKLIRHVNCGSEDGSPCNKVLVCEDNQSADAVDRLKC